jgi:phosphatidylinositol-3-phosphatase
VVQPAGTATVLGMSLRGALPAAGLAVFLAACGASGPAPAATSSAAASSATPAARTVSPAALATPPAHTVIVLEENHGYGEVIGSAQAPYLDQLARQGALFTDSHAITHPSEPNYLALFSGSTQGVTDDSCPHSFSAPNLAAGLLAAGRTFAGYAEDLPTTGSQVCSAGEYARKHVPWTNFSNVPTSDSKPFGAFPAGNYARLPTVSFVIPNLCDDMHDCPVASGDSWLKAHLSGYASWAMTHHSLLIITWDENDGSPGNQIPTIFFGQPVRSGRYPEPITHYSVLRTLEELYRLPLTGHAATASLITGIRR